MVARETGGGDWWGGGLEGGGQAVVGQAGEGRHRGLAGGGRAGVWGTDGGG